MNKAITDGLVLDPSPFSAGLDQWSSEDGTPGSATYQSSPNASVVPADQDFGGCLELVKTDAVQRLRFMGETPLLPGCYLRITARDKPGVVARIAGILGEAGISIEAMQQKEPAEGVTQVPLVLLTHKVRESQMDAAIAETEGRVTAVADAAGASVAALQELRDRLDDARRRAARCLDSGT